VVVVNVFVEEKEEKGRSIGEENIQINRKDGFL